MKKIFHILISLLLPSILLVGCNDILDVDSVRMTTQDQYGKSSLDSLYSTFGVLSRLQKLADSYVLLGELRGDLLDVTDQSDLSLKEITNFSVSANNPYANISDYYAVINNCNYIIRNLDSSAVYKAQKLQLKEYAAMKSIRAWTYMQIALNFKTAKYYEDPILTVADSKKSYPEYGIEELADILIADLAPLKDVSFPGIGYIGSYNTAYSYFPIRFLLGDLYLWKGDYTNAAREYYNLIYKNRYVVSKGFSSSWESVNNTIGSNATLSWPSLFRTGSGEVISTIACPTEYGQTFTLDSLNMQHKIVPSAVALKNWADQTYFLNDASNSQGDLRKYGSVWWKKTVSSNTTNTNTFTTADDVANPYYIFKYMMYSQNVVIYRTALLYLRYAEAINRLNKPNTAFAILKYGLNGTTAYNTKVIPASEKDSVSATFMTFSDSRFVNNVGIRMRGLGNADKDTTFYSLKKQPSMKDSVLFVENLIQKELALETAFEGNRFHDLMRIALRRIKNGEGDESYLATPIAAKHTGNESAIRAKLMNRDNWYIKK
jgi:SusD family.